MTDWNPSQYDRFRDQRAQPFYDLVALVEHEANLRVVDLGCGTGRLTRELHDQLNARETLGIDNSAAMLADCAEWEKPGLSFRVQSIETFRPEEPYDLVFSNAALHWIPDHPALFARLSQFTRPGGQLAVQVPYNFDQPTHTIARELLEETPFRGITVREPSVLAPESYASLLHHHGFTRQHVRAQVYPHLLGSADDVVEWVKGTLLNAYREAMDEATYTEFLDRYRAAIREVLGDAKPLFFPFKRILFWGRRA